MNSTLHVVISNWTMVNKVFTSNDGNWSVHGNPPNTTPMPGDISAVETIPFASKVILIVLYTLTTIAAVSGNSLAILVFTRGRRSNTDLRPFLINLSAADLIMAIFCIPFTFAYQLTGNWVFSDVMCPIVQCCQVVSVTASVSTNTAIGIDRLVAVKFPLRKRVTSSYTRLVILGMWLFAGLLGIVPLLTGRTREENGKLQCEEQWPSHQLKLAYGFFIMVVTYFLPVTILSATYTIIGRQLWRRKLPGNADDHRDAVQLKGKRKVVKMLVTIVLLFGVCWLPLHVFIIVITFNLDAFGDLANGIYFGVHWLSMANSFVNPVVYGFMNENFRVDLDNLLCGGRVSHTCGGHGLKNRAPAVKRRVGDGHFHDAKKGDPNLTPRLGVDKHSNCNNWRHSTHSINITSGDIHNHKPLLHTRSERRNQLNPTDVYFHTDHRKDKLLQKVGVSSQIRLSDEISKRKNEIDATVQSNRQCELDEHRHCELDKHGHCELDEYGHCELDEHVAENGCGVVSRRIERPLYNIGDYDVDGDIQYTPYGNYHNLDRNICEMKKLLSENKTTYNESVDVPDATQHTDNTQNEDDATAQLLHEDGTSTNVKRVSYNDEIPASDQVLVPLLQHSSKEGSIPCEECTAAECNGKRKFHVEVHPRAFRGCNLKPNTAGDNVLIDSCRRMVGDRPS